MTTSPITKRARDISYQVMMAALTQDHGVMHYSDEELLERERTIWEICYGPEEDDG